MNDTIDAIEGDSPELHHLRISKLIVKDLIRMPQTAYETKEALQLTFLQLSRKYKHSPNKRWLSVAYSIFHKESPTTYPLHSPLRYALMKKAVRSASGIVNVTVTMPPDRFSCKYNCKFCPNEPGMPRSYLSNEDAVRRAASVGFNPVEQVHIRFRALEENGHPIDKIEFRVLGGTFSCYEHSTADTFIRDLYYAANIYRTKSLTRRAPLTLEEEQHENTKGQIHVIGLGVETRPDEITLHEIRRFRRYGVTRVELGVQHTNDAILKRLNRGHGVKQSRAAIKLLKDNGCKVEIHIMADLPGSSLEEDKLCYEQILQMDPDLLPDYLKDYPCLDVAYTEIKKWKEDGRWKPYAEEDGGSKLKELLIYRQQITPKWIRVNRIQRDFAAASESNSYLGFTSETIRSNLGDIVTRMAEERGIYCQCIRCAEIGSEPFSQNEIQYTTHKITASGAVEYFLCAEVERPTRNLLLGFIRLRLNNAPNTVLLEELHNHTAMIRELHVYGNVQPVGTVSATNGAQHRGIGKTLLKMAEGIVWSNSYNKVAVISGIGVRDYYRKNGYNLKGTYMIKEFKLTYTSWDMIRSILTLLFIFMAYKLLTIYTQNTTLDRLKLAQSITCSILIRSLLEKLYPIWWGRNHIAYYF